VLLDRDYARTWRLRELAEHVGLAGTYLAALFGAEVGMSPHRYLTERRIEEARRLLVASDLSITAIGIEVRLQLRAHCPRWLRSASSAPQAPLRTVPECSAR